jgi:uncharacterized protein involved in exopolysaccharide biosynthesis
VSLLEFIRLILRYWKVLVLFPLMTALVVFFLTRNTVKEYTSDCEVYTGIASGYGITSGENDRVDYFAVNNAFDNLMATIKSRETIEEVGMRLLAKHLLIEKPSYDQISPVNFDHVREVIPESLRKKLVVKGSEELTYFRIESYKRSNQKNEIIEILKKPTEIYSFDKISANMSALRKQSSDMIDISYKCNDPAACQQTLQIIVDVVIQRYKGIKGSETNNVVKYFEEQLRLSAGRLRKSEDKLRDYSSANKIINYYEQAKFVAESKENVVMDKQKQQMSLQASKAALLQIEKKMNLKKGLLEVNEKIQKLKDQLTDLNYKIANAELYNEDVAKATKIKSDAEIIKRSIRDEVEKQYKLNNTTEGLPRANLLQEWLTNYIGVEENQAKLDVIQKRLDGFDALYTELAPIGSDIKRFERELDVNEKEYLSILHGLNMARLRQQSLEMSNNLTITDTPYLPLEPLPSKRGMLVAVSFIAVFIVTLAVIIAKSLLGKTVQTPGRAEKFTGLHFLGALPNYKSLGKNIIIPKLDEALLSHLTSTIRQHLRSCDLEKSKKVVVTISSVRKEEGKQFFTDKILPALAERNKEILFLNPNVNKSSQTGSITEHPLKDNDEFYTAANIEEWMKGENLDINHYNMIVVILKELNKYNLPEGIISSACLNILLLDSERVWNEADSRALSHFTKSTTGKNLVALNNIEIDRLETIIGEVPKTRSLARRIIKRVITFNFKRT